MVILGITNSETASACLFVNGRLVSAVSEERFSRVKMDDKFPIQSINFCLEENKLKINQVDIISYAWSKGFQEDLVMEYISRYNECDDLSKKIMIERYQVEKERDTPRRSEFWQWVNSQNLKVGAKVEDFYHHEAHALSAVMSSHYDRGAVLTCDGRGDYESLSFWVFDKQEMTMSKLFSSSSVDSLGFFYGRITGLLGFVPCRHEGKITGLAAHGNASQCLSLMKKMISFDGKKIKANLGNYYRPFYSNYSDELVAEVGRERGEDVAAAAQAHLERCLADLVSALYKKNDLQGVPLCLAGGVFANVKVNQRLKNLDCVGGIFVQPQMGDGGLCIGAAQGSLFRRKILPEVSNSMAIGPLGGNKANFIEYLNQFRNRYHVDLLDDRPLISKIIEYLIQDKVVGLVRGRMEFGPRALCHRSILYRTSDKSCNDWLNKRMSRTEFMPFAPVMTEENGQRYLKDFNRDDRSLRFMTSTIDVSDEFVLKSPAVAHIDRTARPQIVIKEEDPWLWDLLDRWSAVTGEVGLINTSFNKHEEPIVLSYMDALSNLDDAVIDVLVVDGVVIRNLNQLG
jgi:carbamoyltransferase